jgi:NADH-quinone oxidoreductase subunit L
MVTAGVYLICRSNAIFDLAPGAQAAVATVGAVTLIFGAIIGCAKDDIKKSLAGSTMSQIGYMVLAAGLGPLGYAFAIAHLLAHGAFKANLFLGAGSVMHAMDDETDMRKYGALRTALPVTFVCFIFGYLAIIGIPPFSGYFTKDKIIESAFDKGGTEGLILGVTALVGAVITAFYMTRMVAMTFFGERRWEPEAHPHESPKVMTSPLIVLAFLSLVTGGFLILGNRLVDFLEPVFGPEPPVANPVNAAVLTPVTLVLIVASAAYAFWVYGLRPVARLAPTDVSWITTAGRRDLYGDAFNEAVFMRPGQYLTRFLVWFDNRVVDGAVNGLAAFVGGVSARSRRVQTGFARSYALSMLAGAIVLVVAVALVRV